MSNLAIGARVRIRYGRELNGCLGTVYNHLPSRPYPWHVRPDGWDKNEAGVALKADEIEMIETRTEPEFEQMELVF